MGWIIPPQLLSYPLIYAFEPVRKTQEAFIQMMKSNDLFDDHLTVVDVVPGEKAIVPTGLWEKVRGQEIGHVVLFR